MSFCVYTAEFIGNLEDNDVLWKKSAPLIVVGPGEKRKSLVCLFVGFFLCLFQITCEDISFQFSYIKKQAKNSK